MEVSVRCSSCAKHLLYFLLAAAAVQCTCSGDRSREGFAFNSFFYNMRRGEEEESLQTFAPLLFSQLIQYWPFQSILAFPINIGLSSPNLLSLFAKGQVSVPCHNDVDSNSDFYMSNGYFHARSRGLLHPSKMGKFHEDPH